MNVYYSDTFVLPLPVGHRFPMNKYALLRARVQDSGIVPADQMHIPHAASDDEILLAHDEDYLRRLKNSELTPKEIRRIGFPWTEHTLERSRRSSGATIEACRSALRDGFAVNLAGGTHHAFREHGEGFCILNDSAIASRVMQKEGMARRIVIIDCDVHQGNGTAAILHGDDSIFTFSIHGHKNYPYHKEISDLDIALKDKTGDAEYLDFLEWGLRQSISAARADLAIYLAGADPFEGDTLGRLALTKEGLAERDCLVFEHCQRAGLPIAISMAGGYGKNIHDTVDIQFKTVQLALEWSPG